VRTSHLAGALVWIVVTPRGIVSNCNRYKTQLFQYFALGRVVQVYFWGESEILLFEPARVFSVDNFNIRALCSGVL
jgi:hypothetical protein